MSLINELRQLSPDLQSVLQIMTRALDQIARGEVDPSSAASDALGTCSVLISGLPEDF